MPRLKRPPQRPRRGALGAPLNSGGCRCDVGSYSSTHLVYAVCNPSDLRRGVPVPRYPVHHAMGAARPIDRSRLMSHRLLFMTRRSFSFSSCFSSRDPSGLSRASIKRQPADGVQLPSSSWRQRTKHLHFAIAAPKRARAPVSPLPTSAWSSGIAYPFFDVSNASTRAVSSRNACNNAGTKSP